MTQIDWSKAGKGFNFYFKGKSSKDVGQFYFVSPLNDRFVSETGSYILFRDMKDIPDLFEIHARPDDCEFTGSGLPSVESTVRIVPGDMEIWSDAKQFIGADCTLKAVFMTGDIQMVAVEHKENLVCCCFRASTIRTPAQLAAEEREKAIEAMNTLVGDIDEIPTWTDALAKLYDAGLRFEVKK